MAPTYIKRYQMRLAIAPSRSLPALPEGYRLMSWSNALIDAHATITHVAFRQEIDASLFPCFRSISGCRELMREMCRKPGFLPLATWLIVHKLPGAPAIPCAAIQGVRLGGPEGGIQNVAVAPSRRRQGLGAALLAAAVWGFQQAGLQQANLEVTADNSTALRLYSAHGFRRNKVLYRASTEGASCYASGALANA